ncbi:hypothetical protein T492DRAFT_1107991 [Pavlovales sp. CCMP2436]|nr:hypothetical protein T492DRAFT_1107991 [Pavlovales sp. CCMP2436]
MPHVWVSSVGVRHRQNEGQVGVRLGAAAEYFVGPRVGHVCERELLLDQAGELVARERARSSPARAGFGEGVRARSGPRVSSGRAEPREHLRVADGAHDPPALLPLCRAHIERVEELLVRVGRRLLAHPRPLPRALSLSQAKAHGGQLGQRDGRLRLRVAGGGCGGGAGG